MLAAALTACLLPGGCQEEPRGQFLTPERTTDVVLLLAGARLPKTEHRIYGHDMSGASRSIHVKFTCHAEQLQEFLRASPVIPDTLLDGFRAFDRPKEHVPFWTPQRMTDVRGLEASWRRNSDEVGLLLMTGTDPDSDLPVTYMLLVVEHLPSR